MKKRIIYLSSIMVTAIVCFCFSSNLQAQVIVLTDYTPNLDACYGTQALNVSIFAQEDLTDGFTVTVSLPQGIEYVPASLAINNTDVELTMVETDISNLNEPVFMVTFNQDMLLGNELSFSIERSANCSAIDFAQSGGDFADLITVNYNNNIINELSLPYTVLFGSLTLLDPENVNGNASDTIVQQLVVLNGGLGCIDSFRYQITNLNSQITALQYLVNDIPINFEQIGNNLFLYITQTAISTIGNNDACLDNGEQVLIDAYYTCPKTCFAPIGGNDNGNSVSWGCTGQSCNNLSITYYSTLYFYPLIPADIDAQVIDTLSYKPGACTNGVLAIGLRNTGLLPAQTTENISFDLFMGSGNADCSLHTFAINGQAFVPIDTFTIISGVSVPYFYFNFGDNTNPLLGLVDTDNNGFLNDLAAGQTLLLTMQSTCPPLADCNDEIDNTDNTTRLNYRFGTCNFSAFRTFYPNYNLNVTPFAYNVDPPLDVFDSQDYLFTFCAGGSNSRDCSTDSLRLAIVLPEGFTPSPISPNAWLQDIYADVDSLPLQTNVSNDTLYVSGIKGTNAFCIIVSLQLNCNAQTQPMSIINWQILYECEETCPPEVFHCDDFFVFTHQNDLFGYLANTTVPDTLPQQTYGNIVMTEANGVCVSTTSINAYRTALGYTDYSFTQIANPDSYLDFAYSCDPITLEAKGVVSGEGSVDNIQLAIIHNSILDTIPSFVWVDGSVQFYDTETNTFSQCQINELDVTTAYTNSATEELWNQRLNINTTPYINNCMAQNNLTKGDSINFTLHLRVANLVNATTSFSDLTEFRAIHYYTYNDTAYSCNHLGQHFYVANNPTYQSDLSLTLDGNVCDTLTFTSMMIANINDAFLNEVRPSVYVDSIDVVLPAQVTYLPNSATYSATYNPDTIPIADPNITLLPNGSTQLRFKNDGSWLLSEYLLTNVAFVYYGGPTISVRCILNSCSAVDANPYFKTTFYYQDRYYTQTPDCYQPTVLSDSTAIFLEGNANDPAYSDSTLQIIIDSLSIYNNTVNIAVKYLNTGSLWLPEYSNTTTGYYPSTKPNAYLLVHSLYNNIELVGVSNLEWQALDEGYFIVYGNDLILSIQTLLSLNVLNCNQDAVVEVFAGWHCEGYPTSINEVCFDNLAHQTIIIPAQPSEVQMSISTNTQTTTLCDTVWYDIVVNSAQLAAIVDPVVVFSYPPLGGVHLAGLPTIEYPLGTPPRSFIPQTTATGITINLNNADATAPSWGIAANGIIGTQYGTFNTRQAHIRLPLQTDCEFVAGSSLQFTVFANKTCGSPAVGNGITQLAQPFQIQDLNIAHTNALSIQPDALNNCNNNTVLHLNITNLGPGSTANNESCLLSLPNGIQYVPNSTQSGNVSIAEPNITVTPSYQLLNYQLPDNLALGANIAFDLTIEVADSLFCTLNNIQLIAQTVAYGNALCVASNQNCEIAVQTNNGSGYFNLSTLAPDLQLSNLQIVTYCGSDVSGIATLSYQLSNQGNAAVNQAFELRFFVDENQNGLLDTQDQLIHIENYEGNLIIGESTTQIATFETNHQPIIVAIVPSDTACNVCETATAYVANYPTPDPQLCNPTPVQLLNFEGKVQPQTNELYWTIATEINCQYYTLLRADTKGNFTEIGKVNAYGNSNTTLQYQYTDTQPLLGTNYYRLQQTDFDGKTQILATIVLQRTNNHLQLQTLLPNPATQNVAVQWYQPNNNFVYISIKNVYGETVYNTTINGKIGINTHTIELQQLVSGTYFVQINNKIEQSTVMFIKM
jgi:hypothetical protein